MQQVGTWYQITKKDNVSQGECGYFYRQVKVCYTGKLNASRFFETNNRKEDTRAKNTYYNERKIWSLH